MAHSDGAPEDEGERAAAGADERGPAGAALPVEAPPLPPRPAWAGASGMAAVLPDSVVAAAYLRRLGYSEEEVGGLVGGEPFKAFGAAPKSLLCGLVQRHVLRVPFENLEYHQAAAPAGQEAALQRLRNVRLAAERIAFGSAGGLCFDLNPAFAWLLRQLGATARLAAAWVATAGGYTASPTHVVVLVDLPDGTYVADPGFGDPPRTAVRTDGVTPDDLAFYEVAALAEGERPAAGFEKVLRRTRASHSLGRHVDNPDAAALDQVEASAAPLFAFRPGDNLAYDAAELQDLVRGVLAPGGSPFAARRLLCLALPRGHVVLSETRSRRVEGGAVVEEVAVDSQATWQKLAGAILARPLLGGELRAGRALQQPRPEGERRASAGGDMSRALESRDAAASKAKNWGTIGGSSIAVGGAGAGGGMGLNAPGFGPRVQHFAGRGSGSERLRSIHVDEEIPKAWARVMDDSDPLGWVFCEYSADGKTLELTGTGEGGLRVFREQLGGAMGWGGFRCCGVDKRGGVECKRPKFIFVQYKPESVPAIKKAKQGSHKGDVKDAICGAHIDVVVEHTVQDLDEQVLITKLQAATGAHKPNGYEFDDGNFLEADFYGLGIGKDCKGETSRN